VQHGPTKTVFEIIARRDLSPDDILTLEDFRARLVHRGEGTTIDADLEVLCGEAVLMALLLLGLAWPVAVNPNR
jgi:tRNA(Ser,Leu) C12 N-acetylase TAN1